MEDGNKYGERGRETVHNQLSAQLLSRILYIPNTPQLSVEYTLFRNCNHILCASEYCHVESWVG
jgi:hypothetical protein